MRTTALVGAALCCFGWIVEGKTCSVVEFGATGDNRTDCTAAFQQAIQACKAIPGQDEINVVLVPQDEHGSVFLTDAIWLGTQTSLQIERNATIQAKPPVWADNGTWASFPPTYVRQAFYQSSHASLVNFGGCLRMRQGYNPWIATSRDACAEWETIVNSSVVGEGTIDGAGWIWWQASATNPPVFPDGTSTPGNRPRLVEVHNAVDFTVLGVTMANSPSWTLHIVESEDVRIADVAILSPPWPHSFNTDGIDLDSVRRADLSRLYIRNGDDAVALWSGAGDAAGALQADLPAPGPTEDVVVRDSVFENSHGATVTEFMAGGTRRVLWQNLTMLRPLAGPHLKAKRGFGGVVEDIAFESVRLFGTQRQPLTLGWNASGFAVVLSMYTDCSGHPGGGNCPADRQPAAATPHMRNISVSGLVCVGACWGAAQLQGLPESPITELRMVDVEVPQNSSGGFNCSFVSGVQSGWTPTEPPATCGLRRP